MIDGVIAVIMTIMLLEFRIPSDGSVISFLKENLVYAIAYILSFIYVVVSWYNQQYMMRHSERVTRRIYIACMLWVLSLSLLPVLAAWTGRTINLFKNFGAGSPKAPALLFLLMICLWGYAYLHMTKVFIADNPGEKGDLISKMEVYRYLRRRFFAFGIAISFVIAWFYPPFVFAYTAGEMLFALSRSRNNMDFEK